MRTRNLSRFNGITRNLLVFASVLTFGYTRAAEPVHPVSALAPAGHPERSEGAAAERSAMDRSLDRALSRHLSFPLLEKGDMTGKVYVSFAIDKEGQLEVLSCASTNDRLSAYVLRKLARVDVGTNPDGISKTTHMVIDFHPEVKE